MNLYCSPHLSLILSYYLQNFASTLYAFCCKLTMWSVNSATCLSKAFTGRGSQISYTLEATWKPQAQEDRHKVSSWRRTKIYLTTRTMSSCQGDLALWVLCIPGSGTQLNMTQASEYEVKLFQVTKYRYLFIYFEFQIYTQIIESAIIFKLQKQKCYNLAPFLMLVVSDKYQLEYQKLIRAPGWLW
jgi:hypothetical protein